MTIDPVLAPGDGEGRLTWLRHNRIDLALHLLRDARTEGSRPLLILHGLGEDSSTFRVEGIDWEGPIYGLDFTGHGRSTIPLGGGYTSEVLAGDVDAALEELGPVTLLGRGLGAYIALLMTAARPELVLGTVLADGPGIAGGGVQPGTPTLAFPPPWRNGDAGQSLAPDPFAMVELSHDVRPPDYAQDLLKLAVENSELKRVFYVTAVACPEWIDAISNQPGVHRGTIDQALEFFAAHR